MPRYRVTLSQKVWQTAYFEIDAPRYSEATMKANDLLFDVERDNVDVDEWSTGDSEEGSLAIDSVELIKEPHRFEEAETGMPYGVCRRDLFGSRGASRAVAGSAELSSPGIGVTG